MKAIHLSWLLIFLFTSCKPKYQKEVDSLLNMYYKSIENKNFDSTLLFYSKNFFDGNTTKEYWSFELQKVQEKFGGFKSYNVIKYSEEHSIGSSEIDVELRVEYDSITFREYIYIKPENKRLYIQTHRVERFDFLD